MTKTAAQKKLGEVAKRASKKYKAYQKKNPNGTKKYSTFRDEEWEKVRGMKKCIKKCKKKYAKKK